MQHGSGFAFTSFERRSFEMMTNAANALLPKVDPRVDEAKPEVRAGSHSARKLVKYGAVSLLAIGAVVAALRVQRAPQASRFQFETAKVDQGEIHAKVTANGALSALVTVNVGSQVSGRVQTLLVDFGSTVKQGEVVATIDPALFQAATAQATANHRAAVAAVERGKAQVLNAEKQFARAASLHKEGLTTSAELETAEANLAVARADLDVARANVNQTAAARAQADLNLKYTTIVSPIDGIVISRNVDVGQTVAATLQAPTLFTIARDLTHMQVDTNIAEADVGRIRAGMDATFTVDAYPKRAFHGQVRQVRDNAQTIQNVVTYDAVVDVDNSERLLKPGMTANVSFTYANRDAAVRLPNAALRFRPEPAALTEFMHGRAVPTPTPPDGRLVWRLDSGNATPVIVQIGVSDGTFTELVSGALKAGDALVVETTDGAKR
jgi:HlyD family secretion protein